MQNECLNLDTGQVCPNQSVSHYNPSNWRLDPNAYADNDSNPYFVGSAAYNAAYPQAAAANAALAAAALAQNAPIVSQGISLPGVVAATVSAPAQVAANTANAGLGTDWTPLLIGLALIILLKR